MLTYVKGNLFDSPAKVLVNTVNTVGVMGKGIALTFKQVYPEMFERYVKLCEAKQFDIGNLWLYRTEHKWVLNFPTKRNWRNPSSLEYVELGLKKFVATYSEQNITSVAFPQLGCGNGELSWSEVGPLMDAYLRSLPINVYVYLYDRDANARVEHRALSEMRHWLRSEPYSMAFDEFWCDLKDVVSANPAFDSRDHGRFTVEAVKYDQEGLLFYFGDRTWFQKFRDSARNIANQTLQRWQFVSRRGIFIPEDAMLELWQSIRFYGICYSQTMPAGLEAVLQYLFPILSMLPYLKEVPIAQSSDSSISEVGLQLFEMASENGPKEESIRAIAA